MTFDDGILTIYKTENIAEPGAKPVIGLVQKDQYYFSFGDIGITRYYTAMQAKQQIEQVVNIPGWGDVSTLDICVLEDGRQYRIVMRQPTHDDDGLRITRLSLERMDESYAVKTESDPGTASKGNG